MVRHWPYVSDYNILFTFGKGRKVEELHGSDFTGINYDKGNDVSKNMYTLLGPYVISNWSDEE